MSQGWVSIHRQIKQHWLWTTDKPFDKRSAWIDLVLSANHTGNKFVLGTQLVTVQKGEFITSELKLMERWGWGKTKLRNFLKLLEDDGMITKKSTNKQTTITIVNYCLYQEPQTTDDTSDKPQANHRQTADVQQTYTNNNVLIMSNNENTYTSASENVIPIKPKHTEDYKTIINYLNEKAGTKYKHTSQRTQDFINARFNDGFSVEDFKVVIDNKIPGWLKDDAMSKYIRPETLFSNKFEGYLNEKRTQQQTDRPLSMQEMQKAALQLARQKEGKR